MKCLELFSGTASFTNAARERGHECLTLDIDPRFQPDYCMDVLDFDPAALPWRPDVIWASPPCQCFSVAALSRYWSRSGPLYCARNDRARNSVALVIRTLDLIKTVQPRYYFIENPRGMLRKMHFMRGWGRSSVTYCQYGARTQKPTDIWNNCLHWRPRPMCKPTSPCHERAPRGAKADVQGIGVHRSRTDWTGASAVKRAIVPHDLCIEIVQACEVGLESDAGGRL